MDGGKKTKDAFAGNVYKRIVETHGLRGKIFKGHLWYGEIVGPGIQTGYEYSLEEVDVYFMDIKQVSTGVYLDFSDVVRVVGHRGEKAVPHLERPFDSKAIVDLVNHKEATSEVDGKTKPIEGFVVRPCRERKFYGGRLILKLLSDKYLLNKDNSDWK
jgi:hypothetical protein